MGLPAKVVKKQLKLLKPLLNVASLEATRKGQDKIGELMGALHWREVFVREHDFVRFLAAWVLPRDERRDGVILYLHGGGYTCGDLEYAKGFASTLATTCGTRVFCPAYRLAPEHPYPAALEDALEAYEYLLSKGYTPNQIFLCGESAGGGLCFALCLRLRELGMAQPSGIAALSPWSDLTCDAPSYFDNQEADPSLTKELLTFYAACYTDQPENPLCSPLFAELKGLPPSIFFVGGDEILLDDTRRLHQKLLEAGCRSEMHVAPGLWHGYLLYHLTECEKDFDLLNSFLSKTLAPPRKLRWMRLDNAAKIFPAARRRNWSNVFRLSATLTEPVDAPVLREALDVTVRRFPSIAVRLRRGLFWYYLEQLPKAPEFQAEKAYPLVHMPFDDIRRCAFRVLVYKNRIAVEFFHALTDGTGGTIFLKTLLAEYLSRKYGLTIPAEHGVLGRLDTPTQEELEDSFLRHAGRVCASRKESTAYHLSGTQELDGFLHLTTYFLSAQALKAAAKQHNVTVSEFLCAAMMQALERVQAEKVPNRQRRKPIKVNLPVNLRQLFPSKTLRNFVSYVTPELDPRLGDYEFDEICRLVRSRLGLEVNEKTMRAKFAANVASERSPILRVMPLFIKNIAMKAVFNAVGECKSCLCLSNLGMQRLPEAMAPYVQRMDFIIGVQARAPYNCGVITWGDTVCINLIRNIRESELERHFARVLQELGLHARVESNQRREAPNACE